MRIGETIATYDVGLALRGKSGRFEITGPTGEIYDVTCKPSHSVANLEWSSNGNDHPPFLIRRIAEGDLLADTKAMTAGLPEAELPEEESLSACSPIPFMLEPAAEEERMPNVGNIELLYLEDNRETGQPSACVYLKSDRRDHAFDGELLMTSRCTTFNELDSEIRRLQAQLDEIRSRAKKMFYKTQAFATSA
ncbi:MAG: hypothetical protein ABSG02_18980 [Terriglobales bacterium]|jgi:hypothetical protein